MGTALSPRPEQNTTFKRQALHARRLVLTDPTSGGAGCYLEDDDSGNLKLVNASGTAVTLSATELAYLDGLTAGTVTASKALVVDANKDLTGIRDLTIERALIRTGQEYQLSSTPKAGATAGWAVNGATNLGELATLPASQTGSTLVLRVTGLKVGWTVTAFKVEAQIESAGGAVTLDADLRKLTNAAGDPVDASVGAITQVSVTADTKVETAKTGLAEVIAADEWLYILITATTAASTDIRLLGCTVTVTES